MKFVVFILRKNLLTVCCSYQTYSLMKKSWAIETLSKISLNVFAVYGRCYLQNGSALKRVMTAHLCSVSHLLTFIFWDNFCVPRIRKCFTKVVIGLFQLPRFFWEKPLRAPEVQRAPLRFFNKTVQTRSIYGTYWRSFHKEVSLICFLFHFCNMIMWNCIFSNIY